MKILLVLLPLAIATSAAVLFSVFLFQPEYEAREETMDEVAFTYHETLAKKRPVSATELNELQVTYGGTAFKSYDAVRYALRKFNYSKSLEEAAEFAREKRDDSNWAVSRSCFLCNIGVMTVQNLVKVGKARDYIASAIATLCRTFKVEKSEVCNGLVNLYKDEVLTVLDQLALDPEEVCGAIVGEDCGSVYNPYAMWYVSWPHPPKPKVSPPSPPPPSAPKMRILHLSDIHLDFQYKPQSNAECDEPLCCRSGTANKSSDAAGYWGDYRHCDVPTWTLESLFQHLESNEKFDAIYWTGDLPGHDVWQQQRSGSIQLLEYLTNLLIKHFPSTPVYSSLGNHEGIPVNSFPPPFIHGNSSVTWLYEELVHAWTHWLPNNTHLNITRGGFYTTLVKPGLRLISVNMNYCNNQNWWLLLNSTDPANEIQWLGSTLQRAEDAGEKVHIVGHIPPGVSSCLKAWSWNYYNIISRYESTITAQFFGHTHFDEVEIFYDVDSSFQRPVSVAYVGPSVTTFSNLNPGYRVYEVDGNYPGSSLQVLDHKTYVMNLTEANLSTKKSPQWKLEYSAKDAYNMSNLYPSDWHGLYERMKTNSTLLNLYYRHYFKLHPPAPECDANTRHMLLCAMITGRSSDPALCRDVEGMELHDIQSAKIAWSKMHDYC